MLPRHAAAGQIFSGSLWESPIISDAVISIASADLNQDLNNDIVYLTKKKIIVASLIGEKLTTLSTKVAGTQTEYHRVSAGDWDGDGQAEILVNMMVRDRVVSELYHLEKNKLVLVHDFDSLVMPLVFDDGEALYSQYMYGIWSWASEIQRVDAKTFAKQKKIKIRSGIGNNLISLWSMRAMDGRLVYLQDDNKLEVIDQRGQKYWRSGMTYGGSVDAVEFETKDAMGLSTESRYPIETRFCLDAASATLFVIKNDVYIGSVLGTVPNVKSSQLIGLSWSDAGFQEKWQSGRYDGALSDLQVIDFDQDGLNEILVAFLVHNHGYLDAYSGNQNTVMALLPVPILPLNFKLSVDNGLSGLFSEEEK